MKRNEAQPASIPAVANDSSSVLKSSAMLSGKVTGFRLSTLKHFLRNMGNPLFIIELWDDTEVSSASGPQHVSGSPTGQRCINCFFNPDLQFGELYVDNRLQVEGDLYKTIRVLCDALPDFTERGIMHRVLAYAYLLKRNTMDRAKDNIHHHYDIGNDFYRLWLDEQFVYTCAYFRQADMSLEQAQIAKLDHVCRKLQLQPGMQVVEAGCGWGALALHMAKHYGVSVKAYNISKEQLAYARTRAANEGLTDQVEFIEGDYRQIEGEYDIFVSVGMLEHVGVKHYRELGETINRVLRPQGRGLIHTIGRNRPMPMNAWIERHIFPGAYPPSLGK
ncbi:MAG: cyclopropane-fatty-acyl-phospholipid synthase family protein [Gammaproteobacteria bacterium]